MYGHPPPRQDSHDSTSEEEILHNHDLTLDKEEVSTCRTSEDIPVGQSCLLSYILPTYQMNPTAIFISVPEPLHVVGG